MSAYEVLPGLRYIPRDPAPQDGTTVGPDCYFEKRRFGKITLIEASHAPGRSIKSASDDYAIMPVLAWGTAGWVDFGGGRIRSTPVPGQCVLAAALIETAYETSEQFHGFGLRLPADRVDALARELDPTFSGDFGVLHARFWDNREIVMLAFRLWRAAATNHSAAADDPEQAFMVLVEALLRQAGRLGPDTHRIHAMAPFQLRRVLDCIEAQPGGDLSLSALARVAGLSPYHFARSFRQDTGLSPHAYVLMRRLDRARRLVATTRAPLSEIADLTGFASQQHMTSAFTRHIGQSPLRLRRRCLGKSS